MNKTFLGSMALAASLLAAPVVLAAPNSTQGDTSGPASGTVTTPSAAVQKQAANPDGTAAGAPGVPASRAASLVRSRKVLPARINLPSIDGSVPS